MVFDRMSDRPAFTGIPTFMHIPLLLDRDELRAERPDVVIVGAPTDAAVTNRPGARYGPRAIRAASNLRRGAYHLGLEVQPFKLLRVFDYGDAEVVPGDIERTNAAIRAKVGEVVDSGALPIVLGGDHSITLPSAGAVAGGLKNERLGVVHFDAHADTADDSWGVLLSHGTPMRRLIESGAVAGSSFVQIGLRGYWPPPAVWDWMREHGLHWHTMHDIQERGFDAVLRESIEQAQRSATRTYLSVDIDVLDPAFAPGTGTPEPGGLSAVDLLRAVREVVLSTDIAGVDVVELSPPYDPSGITAEVCHRVVLEVLSALASKRRES